MGTPPWLDDSRDPMPSRPRNLMESPESKSPIGKNSLTESFNGPNGYHPFGGDGIEVKNYEGGTIDEGNTETIMKLKVLECVPPWQQDQFVPKGFKAEKFIRATGGGKGSDREALAATSSDDSCAPPVFNAPVKCVPPWQQDQLNDYKPKKHERMQGGNNGGDFGGLGNFRSINNSYSS